MKKDLTLLFIGDIFGKTGRNVIIQKLPTLIKQHQIDFVVANAENATHGRSLSIAHYHLLKKVGVNVFTMGNHIFALAETLNYLDVVDDLLRPANYSPLSPGKGSFVFTCQGISIRITNLSGRVFMPHKPENPFLILEKIVKNDSSTLHLVDFHAESTAEKIALAWAFDGQITALLGTHTHVPTADLRLLPKGTLFISDVGMTGPYHSIIGAQPEAIIENERSCKPFKMIPAQGLAQFCAVLFTIDLKTKIIVQKQQIYQLL